MRIEDDMREALESGVLEDTPLVPPWMAKLFVRLVAILLILLMLSFFYINYPIIGQLNSKPVLGNTLIVNEVTVRFADEALSVIEHSYDSKLESTLCLQGKKEVDGYVITSAYVPTIFSQSRTHVSHAACVDTIALFHTHPYKSCLASNVDINTLRQNQATNPDIIMIIQCEPNRYAVYG